MFRTQITKRFFSMFVVGFIGFIIFSGFLISSQISSFMSNASQQLDHKAENVASRIEGRLQQSHGCVGMLALNPLVQEGDSEVLTNLLTKVFEQSPSYEALLVIDSNGTLIAEAPKGSYYKYNSGNNKLTPKPTEHRLLHITTQDGSEYYALTNTVLVKGADSAGESRSMISFVNLNSIVETTFMGSCEDEISIVKKNGEEIALYVPDYDARLDSAPVMIKFLNFIAGQKGLPPLQGAAMVQESEWTVLVSKPYELFWVNNVITVLSGFRFYVLLFIPIVVILILILMGIDHSRRYFKNQALRDSLTGLYNHRYLQDELRSLIKSGKDREISFLMMDLDNFKHVNDTYGHQVGDNILKKVAETLQENVRERDIAARYGGEEFAVILPETESKEAIKVAERIRKAIKACCGCTISIGVSSFLEHGTTADELIKNADLALYKAKDLSKDRVEKIDVKVNI